MFSTISSVDRYGSRNNSPKRTPMTSKNSFRPSPSRSSFMAESHSAFNSGDSLAKGSYSDFSQSGSFWYEERWMVRNFMNGSALLAQLANFERVKNSFPWVRLGSVAA